jgi:murein DD-endopeptidase MepM/ murein hydrolase activator NlpD
MTSLVSSIIVFTPLREYIPGYTNQEQKQKAIETFVKADSLSRELYMKNQYFANLKKVLNDEPLEGESDVKQDSTKSYEITALKKSANDSLLRKMIDEEDKYNLQGNKKKKSRTDIAELLFFTPLRGTISNFFDPNKEHYGIDVSAPENEPVKSTLNGTVFFSEWTIETGNVIKIQHENNLVSSYKHNSVLLKKAGDYVKAGEVIAILGNSGEYSSGPHLHFELWYNGVPLNPLEYINFE